LWKIGGSCGRDSFEWPVKVPVAQFVGLRFDDRGPTAGAVVAVMAVAVRPVAMIVIMVMIVIVVVVMMPVLVIVLVSVGVAVAVSMDVRMVSSAVTMIKRAHGARGTLHQSRWRA
jgi:hypothetical protein